MQISPTCRVRFIPAIMIFFSCIMFIIVAPRVIDLGLEVEAFREMMGNSSLGCRVRVGQMCRDRESGISVILLMVDLRVVDVLGVDVILDMDELTPIGLSVIGTLAGLSYPTRSWSWVRLHMHVVGCICGWNFGTKFFLRRGECKTRETSNFQKKWQNRNFGKNPKFF